MNTTELSREQAAMRSRMQPAPAEPEKPIAIPHLPEPAIQAENRSKDVEVFVRHLRTCRSKRDCRCPRWLYDKLTQKRISARTTSDDAAQREAQRIMDSRDPVKRRLAELERKRKYETVLFVDAKNKYLKDCENRGLAPETIEAYRNSLDQLESFAHGQGAFALSDITPSVMGDWRSTWPDKTKKSKQKKRSHIRTFFVFCTETMHWLDMNANPALALGHIKGKEEVSALPFEEDQYSAILDATYIYENSKRFRDAAARLRGLIQLQRWSGLAIRDALTLPRWKINKHGVLDVRRAKTGTPVTVPLPPKVVEDLRALQNENPEYFFWSGTSRPRALVGDYNRMLSRLWKLVKWPTPVIDGEGNPVAPHSHMLRHTFAYHFLQHGGDIRDLQLLLGHTRLATTEKHYAGFMPGAADRLNAEVRARWAAQNAPGVAKAVAAQSGEQEHHIRVAFRRRGRRA